MELHRLEAEHKRKALERDRRDAQRKEWLVQEEKVHTYIHTYIHIHSFIHTCIHIVHKCPNLIQTYTYIHTCWNVLTYFIHTYIHTYVHIYTYIHTSLSHWTEERPDRGSSSRQCNHLRNRPAPVRVPGKTRKLREQSMYIECLYVCMYVWCMMYVINIELILWQLNDTRTIMHACCMYLLYVCTLCAHVCMYVCMH